MGGFKQIWRQAMITYGVILFIIYDFWDKMLGIINAVFWLESCELLDNGSKVVFNIN